jgi:hypothetical protein
VTVTQIEHVFARLRRDVTVSLFLVGCEQPLTGVATYDSKAELIELRSGDVAYVDPEHVAAIREGFI